MVRTVAVEDSATLLGPNGPFARELVSYEPRAGQIAMALAVERALEHGRVLLCEAGTGTGKTLAYLLPAMQSDKRVVISTATRALQEQILYKDVPVIQRVLGAPCRVALMKGLSNYVCLRRLASFEQSKEATSPRFAAALHGVKHWLESTPSGDLGTMSELDEHHPIWSEIASAADTRLGPVCEHFSQCFVTRMKREAAQADLVIVNHHLVFADLALRGPHPGRVLPDYDAIIFDEAHQIEDIATNFFGIRFSAVGLERLLRDADRALAQAIALHPDLGRGAALGCIPNAQQSARQFWQAVSSAVGPTRGRTTLDPETVRAPVAGHWLALDTALESLEVLLEHCRSRQQDNSSGLSSALELGHRRTRQARDDMASIMEPEPGLVTWFEHTPRNDVLTASPVDVSTVLGERLFRQVPSVVLTSATLATTVGSSRSPSETPWAYVRKRLGLEDTDLPIDELLVPSPFDFPTRALLYVPRDLPAPGTAEFVDASAARIRTLVAMCDGGAFVLTTSLRSMTHIHARLRQSLSDRPVLLQGASSKQALLDVFRASGRAVLVATMSFWEGVDVPGQTLRLVVLEKVPFPVPTDPIIQARGQALEASGRSAFSELYIPSAALTLKQGFGRLIRTRADYGVVAVLDGRLHSRGYGARILSALPAAAQCDDLDTVQRFWNERAPEHPIPED